PAILTALAAHGEDAGDANLPLMIWYAAEPLIARKPTFGYDLLGNAKMPLLREYAARRLASLPDAAPLEQLVRCLGHFEEARELDLLRGMNAALHGRKDVKPPRSWPEAFAKARQSAAGEKRE